MASFARASKWILVALLPPIVGGFVIPFFSASSAKQITPALDKSPSSLIGSAGLLYRSHNDRQSKKTTTSLHQSMSVQVEATLDDEKIEALFAWIAQAYAGEYEYNNLMLAFAAIFGNLPEDSEPRKLAIEALKRLPKDAEFEPCGEPFSLDERERNSLGAMGAAQWTGQWKTRPHALLQVKNLTSVDDWIKSLPRGCRRTVKKATNLEEAGNFTIRTLPIYGNQPAPHSCLAHFRCVAEHEVRLLANQEFGADANDFFQALSEAVSRYMGTTQMAGEIREYRNTTTGRVIALAHEVRKGKTIRGQWFYATDEASKNYVWFHSVYDLVRRSIEADGVNVVDLGPSGSDAFSQLKGKYGFASVDDWPAVADYQGPFWYNDTESGQAKKGIAGMASFFEQQWGEK